MSEKERKAREFFVAGGYYHCGSVKCYENAKQAMNDYAARTTQQQSVGEVQRLRALLSHVRTSIDESDLEIIRKHNITRWIDEALAINAIPDTLEPRYSICGNPPEFK